MQFSWCQHLSKQPKYLKENHTSHIETKMDEQGWIPIEIPERSSQDAQNE
jgi:hypothetical protein